MPCARASLIAHSVASEPVVSRKTFFSPSGATPARHFDQRRALFARETVIVQQAAVHLVDDGLRESPARHGRRWSRARRCDQSSQRLPYLS